MELRIHDSDDVLSYTSDYASLENPVESPSLPPPAPRMPHHTPRRHQRMSSSNSDLPSAKASPDPTAPSLSPGGGRSLSSSYPSVSNSSESPSRRSQRSQISPMKRTRPPSVTREDDGTSRATPPRRFPWITMDESPEKAGPWDMERLEAEFQDLSQVFQRLHGQFFGDEGRLAPHHKRKPIMDQFSSESPKFFRFLSEAERLAALFPECAEMIERRTQSLSLKWKSLSLIETPRRNQMTPEVPENGLRWLRKWLYGLANDLESAASLQSNSVNQLQCKAAKIAALLEKIDSASGVVPEVLRTALLKDKSQVERRSAKILEERYLNLRIRCIEEQIITEQQIREAKQNPRCSSAESSRLPSSSDTGPISDDESVAPPRKRSRRFHSRSQGSESQNKCQGHSPSPGDPTWTPPEEEFAASCFLDPMRPGTEEKGVMVGSALVNAKWAGPNMATFHFRKGGDSESEEGGPNRLIARVSPRRRSEDPLLSSGRLCVSSPLKPPAAPSPSSDSDWLSTGGLSESELSGVGADTAEEILALVGMEKVPAEERVGERDETTQTMTTEEPLSTDAGEREKVDVEDNDPRCPCEKDDIHRLVSAAEDLVRSPPRGAGAEACGRRVSAVEVSGPSRTARVKQWLKETARLSRRKGQPREDNMDSCDASAEDSSSSVVSTSDDEGAGLMENGHSPLSGEEDQEASVATLRPSNLPLRPRLRPRRSSEHHKPRPWSMIHLQGPSASGLSIHGPFSHSESALNTLLVQPPAGFGSRSQTSMTSTPTLGSPMAAAMMLCSPMNGNTATLTPSPKKTPFPSTPATEDECHPFPSTPATEDECHPFPLSASSQLSVSTQALRRKSRHPLPLSVQAYRHRKTKKSLVTNLVKSKSFSGSAPCNALDGPLTASTHSAPACPHSSYSDPATSCLSSESSSCSPSKEQQSEAFPQQVTTTKAAADFPLDEEEPTSLEPISLEQAWDPYQAPVFASTRGDSSEEGVDEDKLKKLLDWDDYRTWIDSLSDATSVTRGSHRNSPLRAFRKRKSRHPSDISASEGEDSDIPGCLKPRSLFPALDANLRPFIPSPFVRDSKRQLETGRRLLERCAPTHFEEATALLRSATREAARLSSLIEAAAPASSAHDVWDWKPNLTNGTPGVQLPLEQESSFDGQKMSPISPAAALAQGRGLGRSSGASSPASSPRSSCPKSLESEMSSAGPASPRNSELQELRALLSAWTEFALEAENRKKEAEAAAREDLRGKMAALVRFLSALAEEIRKQREGERAEEKQRQMEDQLSPEETMDRIEQLKRCLEELSRQRQVLLTINLTVQALTTPPAAIDGEELLPRPRPPLPSPADGRSIPVGEGSSDHNDQSTSDSCRDVVVSVSCLTEQTTRATDGETEEMTILRRSFSDLYRTWDEIHAEAETSLARLQASLESGGEQQRKVLATFDELDQDETLTQEEPCTPVADHCPRIEEVVSTGFPPSLGPDVAGSTVASPKKPRRRRMKREVLIANQSETSSQGSSRSGGTNAPSRKYRWLRYLVPIQATLLVLVLAAFYFDAPRCCDFFWTRGTYARYPTLRHVGSPPI